MRIVFVLVVISALASCATGPNQFGKSMVNKYGLDEYSIRNLDDPNFKARSAFIYTLLANTEELRIHQFNGETKNEVWVSNGATDSGGYAELVVKFKFDENGNRIDGTGAHVRDCENMGSFNYKHPVYSPLGHFAQDILPWIEWGNCSGDTTSQEQRISAYVEDIEIGLERVIASGTGYVLPVNFSFSESGQAETIAFFIKAFELAEFELYPFIMEGASEPKSRKLFIASLEKGLIEIF